MELSEYEKGVLRGLVIWIAGEMYLDEETSPDALGHKWLAILKKILDWDKDEQKAFEDGLRDYIEELKSEDDVDIE